VQSQIDLSENRLKYPEIQEIEYITKGLGDFAGNATLGAALISPTLDVMNRLSDTMMASAGGFPLPSPYPSPADMAKPNVASQVVRDNAGVVDNMMKNYTKATPAQQKASGDFVRSVLQDPYTANSAPAWDALLPTLANPEFRQYAKAASVDINDPVIKTNTRAYIRALARDSRSSLVNMPEGVSLSMGEEGLVLSDVYAIKDQKQRDGLIRAIERINLVLDAGVNTMGYPNRSRAYQALVVPSLMGQN
jgi:hypothetical protein